MTEELITFPTARLAKEFGFNWQVWNYFDENGLEGKTIFKEKCDFNYGDKFTDRKEYSRPTQALLAKWLREAHYIEVSVSYGVECKWGHISGTIPGGEPISYGENYETHELAFEAGLLDALEYLANEKKSSGH